MISVAEKPTASSTVTVDPLLKDLNEKKQSFKRNVVSLASELKELRNRLSFQEQSFSREILNRQVCQEFIFAPLCLCFLSYISWLYLD
ncbi:Hypothetical predicted protein [Olea europaea subsp. europaea]|uniref:Uncharacterized protein n=2 Tax=Olea europaea subsp. europaea TaxID=158383 RepID=A0A8S0Q774_OLEEU|nr:Hypothetical predicted protein [Olea europaea subsp. europaea]